MKSNIIYNWHGNTELQSEELCAGCLEFPYSSGLRWEQHCHSSDVSWTTEGNAGEGGHLGEAFPPGRQHHRTQQKMSLKIRTSQNQPDKEPEKSKQHTWKPNPRSSEGKEHEKNLKGGRQDWQARDGPDGARYKIQEANGDSQEKSRKSGIGSWNKIHLD